ncbi:cysteine hydrolase family protein [Haloferax sp. DFSO60]|uniref:cysteine hydrolase family protein n=1 Tax=Haloferax sp. DFSO60 TaxID=3388652 RepID=UPI003979A9C8
MVELPSDAVLVCIDMQTGFDNPAYGERNNPDMEATVAELLATWREGEKPIVHIRHDSQEPDSPLRSDKEGFAWKPEAVPEDGELVLTKRVNSGFIGTELESWLHENDYSTLVVCGLTTDHCVSTTTRMAENLGFEVYLVEDAVATFEREGVDGEHYSAEEMHRTALAHLNGEFAMVVESEHVNP